MSDGFERLEQSNTLLATGLGWTPFASEYLATTLRILVGFNSQDNALLQPTSTLSWGGIEPLFGTEVGISFFPTHTLEVGFATRVDMLMGGSNSDVNEWEGKGITKASRISVAPCVRLAAHF